MLRAIRMAAEYDFNLESHAFQAMRHMGRNLSKAGPDRARTEFLRLICAPHASRGLKLMVDTHLLEVICGISSEMMSQDNLVAISNLIQTIDETPKNATTRLPLFYRCFGKNLGQTAIETLHYDKKTRKQLESTLTEGICLQKRNAR